MTLPPDVEMRTATFGRATSYAGNNATIVGTVTANQTIVHEATGIRICPDADPMQVAGGELMIDLPTVDQAGFLNGQRVPYTGWMYVLNYTITYASGKTESGSQEFQLFSTDPSVVDVDLRPDGPFVPGTTGPQTNVVQVAGLGGPVVSPADLAAALEGDLAATFVPRWKANMAYALAALVVNPSGQTVSAKAAFTSGATYSAADWNIVAGGTSTGGLPVLARCDITTAAQVDITSTTTTLPCIVTFTNAPGYDDYAGSATIRVRGNSTSTLPKKPYKLKLDTAAPLLGMPSDRDWALLANAYDASLINNGLALTVGALTDLAWTPRFQYVEVYVNGSYNGFYQLTESVKLAANRINATKASGTTGLPLTGAYSLEIDERETTFRTDLKNVSILMDDPDGTTLAHQTYIQNHLDAFETVLYGNDFADPTAGYAAWIDPTSFADWYLVEEFFLNTDSDFYSSCKFVKRRDTNGTAAGRGKIVMGPLWDFDLSLGLNLGPHPGTDASGSPTSLYTRPQALWINRLYEDPAFRTLIGQRWTQLKTRIDAAGGTNAIVDSITRRVANAAQADKTRWSYSADWAALATAKKTFLTARRAFFDTNIMIPIGVPDAPTSPVATAGPTSASIAFSPPSTGNTYITDYVVSASTGQTASGTFSPIVVTGLTAGTPVTFTVRATNASGVGPASAASNSVTPTAGSGGGGPALPATIEGLALWFDASQEPGSRADDTEVTTAVNREGTTSRSATAVSGGPAYRKVATTGVPLPPSGLPTFYFDGTKRLQGATGLSSAAGLTVFLVMAATGPTPTRPGTFCTGGDDYSTGLQLGMNADASQIVGLVSGGAIGGPDRDINTTTTVANKTYLQVTSIRGAGSVTDYVDGAPIATASGGASSVAIAGFAVGARFYEGAANSPLLVGCVSDLIVYNRTLSTIEREQVESYLRTKWGTPAPA